MIECKAHDLHLSGRLRCASFQCSKPDASCRRPRTPGQPLGECLTRQLFYQNRTPPLAAMTIDPAPHLLMPFSRTNVAGVQTILHTLATQPIQASFRFCIFTITRGVCFSFCSWKGRPVRSALFAWGFPEEERAREPFQTEIWPKVPIGIYFPKLASNIPLQGEMSSGALSPRVLTVWKTPNQGKPPPRVPVWEHRRD
jgi:hypothetical protein